MLRKNIIVYWITCFWISLYSFSFSSEVVIDALVTNKARIADYTISGNLKITHTTTSPDQRQFTLADGTIFDEAFTQYVEEKNLDLWFTRTKCLRYDFSGRNDYVITTSGKKVDVPAFWSPIERFSEVGTLSYVVRTDVMTCTLTSIDQGIFNHSALIALDPRGDEELLLFYLQSPGRSAYKIAKEGYVRVDSKEVLEINLQSRKGENHFIFQLDPENDFVILNTRNEEKVPNGQIFVSSETNRKYLRKNGLSIPVDWKSIRRFPKGGGDLSLFRTEEVSFTGDPTTLRINQGLKKEVFLPVGMGVTSDYSFRDTFMDTTGMFGQVPESSKVLQKIDLNNVSEPASASSKALPSATEVQAPVRVSDHSNVSNIKQKPIHTFSKTKYLFLTACLLLGIIIFWILSVRKKNE